MTVHFIGAGPGAADLLTLRGRNLIAGCPVCLYAGSLVPREILSHCPAGARIINTAPLNLDAIIAEQLRRLRAKQIPVTITPGVPSFAAAAAALETELTLPGLAQSLVLTRTPGRASAMPDTETLENFARTKATLAIHLSVHNLAQVVETLTPAYGAACPAAVVYRASWPDQQIIRGQLNTLRAGLPDDIERTALILVGPALGEEGFEDSCLYANDYDRRFRPQIARQKGKA
jgi:precorrin-4/cobalt-precorrin-4 C11-methyltransferase